MQNLKIMYRVVFEKEMKQICLISIDNSGTILVKKYTIMRNYCHIKMIINFKYIEEIIFNIVSIKRIERI